MITHCSRHGRTRYIPFLAAHRHKSYALELCERISTNVTASREVDNRVVVVPVVAAALMTWLCYGGATRGIKKGGMVEDRGGGAVAPLSK